MNKNVVVFLQELGFCGVVLESMKSVIKDGTSLEDFQSFILLNDGKYSSNVELGYMYIESLKERSTYSREQFILDFEVNQVDALEKTVKSNVNVLVLKKVKEILNKGLTVGELYDNLIKYNQYNPLQCVKLIEINLKK